MNVLGKQTGTPARTLAWGLSVLFLLGNIFDMAGRIGFKYIPYLLVTIYILNCYRHQVPIRHVTVWLALFLVWPFFEVFQGIINGAGADAVKYMSPFAAIPLTYMLARAVGPLEMAEIMFRILLWLAIVVIAVNVVMAVDVSLLEGVPLMSGLFDNIDYYAGVREGHLVPRVYPRATLFFVPAAVYYLYTGRPVLGGILAAAIALTVSKGGMLVLSVFVLLYLLLRASLRRKLLYALIVALFAVGIQVAMPDLVSDIIKAVTGESETTTVRLQHIASLLDFLSLHPVWLLFGQGFGTVFYSGGEGAYVGDIEVAHLEVVRRYGLIWAILFFGWIVFVGMRLIQCRQGLPFAMGMALFSGFLASGTNPVLISPPFLILAVLAFVTWHDIYALQEARFSHRGGVLAPD